MKESMPPVAEVADRLHSLAIHLLRRLRRVDSESRLTGPRLSALSVVVFGGPITLSDLASAEQVSRPTMTRLVQALEREGLLQRTQDKVDARIARVAATPRGLKVMREGRERRVQMLASLLQALPASELKAVRRAILSLEPIVAGRRNP
jgi:DNA-binding MarR family transcriptional regulator